MMRRCMIWLMVALLGVPQHVYAITDTDIEALGQPASASELETFIDGTPKKTKKNTCLKGCLAGACCMVSFCSVAVVFLLYLATNRSASTRATPGIAAGGGGRNHTVVHPMVDPCYTMCAALKTVPSRPQGAYYIPSVLLSGDIYMFLKQCTPEDFAMVPALDRVLDRRIYEGHAVCDLPGPPFTVILSTLTLPTTTVDDDMVPFLTGVPATSVTPESSTISE